MRDSGIGFAVASAFASAGCTRILLVDSNEAGLKSAQDKLTTKYPELKALCLSVDISQEGAMEKALEKAMSNEGFRRVDYAGS